LRFSKAIVRRPGRNLVKGISSATLGKPDYDNACCQHDRYIAALKRCGVKATVLDADERFPDSTFVEDTAVVTEKMAVVCRPGVDSRRGEESEIAIALRAFFPRLERIQEPGTLEGGDVLRIGRHFYIGVSQRTNPDGAGQLLRILSGYGYTGSLVPLQGMLHLKSGLAYLEKGNLLATGELVSQPLFSDLNLIEVDASEAYAANSLWINGRVLVPEGFAKTAARIAGLGYPVVTIDVGEFRKLDGGLSCLSLRF